jgi:hypothetical protein
MSQSKVRLLLVVQDRLVAGTLSTGGRRILEVLVDTGSNYLRLRDAKIQSNSSNSAETELEEVVVWRPHISLIALAGTEHEAPDKRCFGFVQKEQFSATVVVSGWQVVGDVHVKGHVDPFIFLERETGAFFPLTNAAMQSNGAPVLTSPGRICEQEPRIAVQSRPSRRQATVE